MSEKKYVFKSILDDFYEEYNPKKQVPSISTGYQEWDRILDGGFKRTETNIIAGTSGVGKTTVMANCSIRQAQRGFKVMNVCLEMKKIKLYERVIPILKQEDAWKWKMDYLVETYGEKNVKFQIDSAYQSVAKEIKANYTMITEEKEMKIKGYDIIKVIEQADQAGFDIVYLDNYQILTAGMDHNQIVAISEKIRETVLQTNLAFVHLSQVTVKDQEAMNFLIRNGQKLKDDAANLTILYKKYEELTHTEEKEGAKAEAKPYLYLYIQKNRYGKDHVELELPHDERTLTIGEFVSRDQVKQEKKEIDLFGGNYEIDAGNLEPSTSMGIMDMFDEWGSNPLR